MRRIHRTAIVTILLVSLSVPARADERNPFAWPSHRSAADHIGTAAVVVQLGAETIKSLRADDRRQALGCEALRVGLTVGIAELTKAIVHRTRPDGSDRKSFFSEHTALATVSGGWRVGVSVPIAVGVGYLRPAANRHFTSDVLVGAAVGALARRVCKGEAP